MHVVDQGRRRMCIAEDDVAEVSCLDASGARRIIRWNGDVVSFTAEDRARTEERMWARVDRKNPAAVAEMEKRLAEWDWPETFPRIHGFQVDALGNLWIRETYRPESGGVGIRMRVVDAEGQHLAFANDVPIQGVGLWPEVIIGEDRVIRVYTDENDLPRVGVFRIRKP